MLAAQALGKKSPPCGTQGGACHEQHALRGAYELYQSNTLWACTHWTSYSALAPSHVRRYFASGMQAALSTAPEISCSPQHFAARNRGAFQMRHALYTRLTSWGKKSTTCLLVHMKHKLLH